MSSLAFDQIYISEQMMSHMRFTHSELANDIDNVKQLIETNHTVEALTLLEGMGIKINHMNTIFNNIVWELYINNYNIQNLFHYKFIK
ncbi:MAG TPA: hypothetical protein VFV86_00935 [Nitrososphaeraceae archaeon]|nr:hypothetical protein [Nitrososphaeraceae archaeon]